MADKKEEKKVLIEYKGRDVKVISNHPYFEYVWQDKPIEVLESHVEKILRNPDFKIKNNKKTIGGG